MKPRVAFFEFTCCEGCQLDALDLTGTQLYELLDAVDIVTFREAISEQSDEYDIAIVEGSISRNSDIARLKEIRGKAKIVIAFGACACTGGVNTLKNYLPMGEAMKLVYGPNCNYETMPAQPLSAHVDVDFQVRGCPASDGELLIVVKALLLGKKPDIPGYPVCVQCKMAGNICVYERGMSCVGPITRAGCKAVCVTSGQWCRGCRGLVDEPNIDSQKDIMKKYGLSIEQMVEKFKIYNITPEVAKK